MTVHWYSQEVGNWPNAACGHRIRDELGAEYTLWMSKVTCERCRAAVQAAIHSLRPVPAPERAPAAAIPLPLPGLPPRVSEVDVALAAIRLYRAPQSALSSP